MRQSSAPPQLALNRLLSILDLNPPARPWMRPHFGRHCFVRIAGKPARLVGPLLHRPEPGGLEHSAQPEGHCGVCVLRAGDQGGDPFSFQSAPAGIPRARHHARRPIAPDALVKRPTSFGAAAQSGSFPAVAAAIGGVVPRLAAVLVSPELDGPRTASIGLSEGEHQRRRAHSITRRAIRRTLW